MFLKNRWSYLLIIVMSFLLQGCLNNLVFDQNQIPQKATAQTFEKQIDDFQRGFSMQNEKKEYETNRIFSSDFPVTYRAKTKKTF